MSASADGDRKPTYIPPSSWMASDDEPVNARSDDTCGSSASQSALQPWTVPSSQSKPEYAAAATGPAVTVIAPSNSAAAAAMPSPRRPRTPVGMWTIGRVPSSGAPSGQRPGARAADRYRGGGATQPMASTRTASRQP